MQRFILVCCNLFIGCLFGYGAVVKIVLEGYNHSATKYAFSFKETFPQDSLFGNFQFDLTNELTILNLAVSEPFRCDGFLFESGKMIGLTGTFMLVPDTTIIVFKKGKFDGSVINVEHEFYRQNKFTYLGMPAVLQDHQGYYPDYAKRDYALDTSYNVLLALKYSEYERNVMNDLKANSSFIFNLFALYEIRNNLTLASLNAAWKSLPVRFQQSLYGKRLNNYIATRARLVRGNTLPSLSLVDSNGAVYQAYAIDWQLKHRWVFAIWASWCKPCLADLKKLNDNYESLTKAGIGVVTINVDDSSALWKKSLARQAYKWKDYHAMEGYTASLQQRFAITGIPFHLLLDEYGRIVQGSVSPVELEVWISGKLLN